MQMKLQMKVREKNRRYKIAACFPAVGRSIEVSMCEIHLVSPDHIASSGGESPEQTPTE